MKIRLVLLSFFFAACSQSPSSISGLDLICASGRPSGTIQLNSICAEGKFLTAIKNAEGIMRYDTTLKKSTVIVNVDKTIDCQIIGILCNDQRALEGKKIRFDANAYTYVLNWQPNLGGQVATVLIDFSYSVQQ